MENIICPICGSTANSFYHKKNNCKLYRCHSCGLVFVFPIPEDINNLYGRNYFKLKLGEEAVGYVDYDQDKESMKEIFELYLEKFESLVNGRKIFDIGAATGYFLGLAKKQGWQTSGSEISDYAANEARKRGHKIFCGDLLTAPVGDKYDVITMWDVLEHVKDPQGYVSKAEKMINKGGLLAINTVDRGSLWAKIMGRRWPAIVPPEHLFYFNKKNLKILLNKEDFEIIEISKIGKKFSLSYIFKTLYYWQGMRLWNSLSVYFNKPFWRKFSIPINLRDNIFILTKKI